MQNVLTREQFAALPLAERLVQLYDPFIFMKYAVWTRDEVDAKAPVKPAPVWENEPLYKPYIEPITRVWQNEQTVILDKARRMYISYLMLILHLHLAMTNTDRRVGIVSKKFEDSCAHLENMKAIYENIPEAVWPSSTRPELRSKEGFIYFDSIGSVIHAMASGPDQARQYGFSALFFDEFDFWDNQEATYGAAAPTLQGGGKLTIATTHSFVDTGVESFYRRMLEDRL